MHFEIPINSIFFERKEIKVVHEGKEVYFSVHAFTRTAFETTNEPSAIFDHINRYIQSLDISVQDRIFGIYEEIRNIFDTVMDFDTAKNMLMHKTQQLYGYFNFEAILQWMKFNTSDIQLPSTKHIKTTYNDIDERNHIEDKTYIMQDYIELIALVIQLRPMIPIWGEYIRSYANVIGTTFKEYSAYELYNLTQESPNRALHKLQTYVETITPQEGSREAIVELISSEDYPLWNLALLIVRKVCLFDIRGKYDDTPILVRHIFTHVREKIKHSSNTFDGQIKDKVDTNTSTQSEENQISRFESFKTKELTSTGDRVFIERMVSNPLKLAYQLDQSCPPELVMEFLSYIKNSTNPLAPLSKVQNNLVKMVCAPVIPHRGIDYLDVEKHNCIAAAQAVLWHNGFHLIAGVLSANRVSDNHPELINTNNDARAKVNPELKEKLLSLFPFTRRTKNGKEIDVVSNNIEYLVNHLCEEIWVLRLPADKVAMVNTMYPTRFRLVMPPNIKNIVTELAIYLANREVDTVGRLLVK